MKILYLILLYNGEINGGHSYRMATAKAIRNIVGYENLDIVLSELDHSDWQCNVALRLKSYSSWADKIKNLTSGNITQRSNDDIKKVIKLIRKNKYDVVLFGSSETGKLIKEVKKKCPGVKTITWYHDIVADVIERKKREELNFKMLPIWNAEKKAEGIDASLTDIAIVLHQRDADLLYKYWGRKTNVFIPIALEDKFKENGCLTKQTESTLQLLFVGAYNWKVNVEAVQWFCENVMKCLENYNVIFNVAGFQMEKLKDDGWINNYKNVTVLGTVDNLSDVYKFADVVVEPIIHGSGMKVKTAEALMYGKEIIGTEEALVGYKGLENKICFTAQDFINSIIKYCERKPDKFVKTNRQLYKENYSIPALEEKLKVLLQSD